MSKNIMKSPFAC